MKFLTALFLLAAISLAPSCQNSNAQKDKGTTLYGIPYEIYRSGSDEKAVLDEMILGNLNNYYIFENAIIDSSSVKDFAIKYYEPERYGHVGDFIEVMREGDSGIFLVQVDSLIPEEDLQGKSYPKGTILKSIILFKESLPEEMHQSRIMEENREFTKGQIKEIEDYLLKNNIREYYESGDGNYIFTIEFPGTGLTPQLDDLVSLDYAMSTLGGSVIRSSFESDQTFDFRIGDGQAFRAWSDFMSNIRVGGRATLYLPSDFAFGRDAIEGFIPENSIIKISMILNSVEKD